MDRDTAMRKIEKCLALSKSSEPHEAARAMHQAQVLMEQFSIEHPELLAMGVGEQWGKSRATKTPPAYEVFLAQVVANGFGCEILFGRRWAAGKVEGGYIFIGAGPSPDVAQYTFTVLARKLIQARTAYTKEKLSRYRKNKVAAADLFCNGWVHAVSLRVASADVTADRRLALDAYIGLKHPKSGDKETRSRKRSLADESRAWDHRKNGWLEGKTAAVRDGLESHERATQLTLGY